MFKVTYRDSYWSASPNVEEVVFTDLRSAVAAYENLLNETYVGNVKLLKATEWMQVMP